MTGRTDANARVSTARIMLAAGVALALAATAVLVLSDSLRWMRIGVVAALWAALVGGFLAARYRRQVVDRAEDIASLQQVYELELEREIAARREFELETEAKAAVRAEEIAEEKARDELAGLRQELRAMRENLERMLGGEVLVERIALRAEATRMRAGEQRAVGAAPNGQLRRIAAAKPVVAKPVPGEAETELIERIDVKAQPPVRRVRRPDFTPHPSEVSDRWLMDGSNGDPIDPNWTPSWESGVRPLRAADQTVRRVEPVARPPRLADKTAVDSAAPKPAQDGGKRRALTGKFPPAAAAAAQGRRAAEAHRAAEASGYQTPVPPRPAETSGYQAPVPPRPAETSGYQAPVPPRPAEISGYQEPVKPVATKGSHAQATGYQTPVAPPTNGRPAPDPVTDTGGRRRKPDPAPGPAAEQAGSHSAGKSVRDLLAAHGATPSARRRRRRED